MKTTKWENYGDVNPVEHGGMFVSKDNEIEGCCYYVIEVRPSDEMENTWFVIDGYVDLEDEWIEWESIKACCDTPDNADDENLVVDAVYYYGTEFSNGELMEFNSEDEITSFLVQRGIEL